MKEFLDSEKNYTYVQDTARRSEGWIEIPEGATHYSSKKYADGAFFIKVSEFDEYEYHQEKWLLRDNPLNKMYFTTNLLWQRHTQPEELPFIDDEPKSLNDQYAEIEKVRKDNVNHPKHYASGAVECIDAIQAGMSEEMFEGYLKGCCNKYLWRYKIKGGSESLRKAEWYLKRLIELNEKIESRNR